MAEHKVNGGDMLLFIDPLGGTNYDTVVCLTSVGISDSVQPVDASSACGPDKSPGAVDMSISFEGQHLQDPNTGNISGTDLRILLRAEQTIGWKLSPVSPQPGDEIQSGTGYLSELSSTYSYSEVGVFSGTIQPYGVPTLTIYGGGSLTIGQSYQGGKIAYIDGSGIHGIIVANQTYDIEWCINTGTLFYANYTVYGAGDLNNSIILSNAVPVTSSAAYVTDVYTNDGYNDWYMPTYDDCGLMYAGLSACGYGTLGTWSGTEFDGNFAYLMDNTGSIGLGPKDSVNTIIPIRYF